MSIVKKYNDTNVYDASIERINFTLDNFERVYIALSGGKDSTVMAHMIINEAKKRNIKVGVLVIDLEAQYKNTIDHLLALCDDYKENIDLYWVCLPLRLRNAVSNFEPNWHCWDKSSKKHWVRSYPKIDIINSYEYFDFYQENMEFEEFMVLFGKWYSQGKHTAGFIGIRSDESLNRFRAISSKTKLRFKGKDYITNVVDELYNVYPIYDWKVSDIWKFHYNNTALRYNKIYDLMYKAGVSYGKMRICQPYGDEQKQGLWLYHILEPETWSSVVRRVSGVNSFENLKTKINKPANLTWQQYTKAILKTMPEETRNHYITRFRKYISLWTKKGYNDCIPDEVPEVLENKNLAPSWRMICTVLLKNDWWCKSLGMSIPKSEAYGKYLEIRNSKK